MGDSWMADVGQASSHSPQYMQRAKLIRNQAAYRHPSSRSADCIDMQLTGQTAEQR
jgi:hypothetical protein